MCRRFSRRSGKVFLPLPGLVLGIWIGLSAMGAVAQTGRPSEHLVKATFLYNFAKFAQWPEDSFEEPGSPLLLCVLSEKHFQDALRTIEGKTVRGRPISVRHCRPQDPVPEKCHIFFMDASEEKRLPGFLSKLKGLPCLTVGDSKDFIRHGGMVRFFNLGKKVRFEINPEAANRSGIKISSKLLKLSKIFRE